MSFLFWWVVFSMGTLVWILLTEMANALIRPDYWPRIMRYISQDKSKIHWTVGAVIQFLLWWIMLIDWILAAREGKTFFERLIERDEVLKAKRKSREAQKVNLEKELERAKQELFERHVVSVRDGVIKCVSLRLGRELRAEEIEEIERQARRMLRSSDGPGGY